MKQKQANWQSGAQDIGGVTLGETEENSTGTATVTYTQSTGKTTITFGA